MASPEPQFLGWVGHDKSSAEGNMKLEPFHPKTFTPNDVDIAITHCGVCGSDIHTLRSGWGPTLYPIVVGHEIIGTATRVGSNVTHIKVGDRVGVGAQNDACLGRKGDCYECGLGLENHCVNKTDTYNALYYVNEGVDVAKEGEQKSMGGYANFHRAAGAFVFPIPEGLESAHAAPMMCGGITVFSPLRTNGCGPGKRVGIVGVGGLGHFGVLFAKALGADEVVGISRKRSKEKDVLALGADRYIATDDDKDWVQNNSRTLDLIICTVSSPKMPLRGYISLLRVNGKFVQVGAPEEDLPPVNAFDLLLTGSSIGGSSIGNRELIREMLQLAADKKIKPWVEERSMRDANRVIIDMEEGRAKFRYTMVQDLE